jgi:uncharacterized protein (DUF427 family)
MFKYIWEVLIMAKALWNNKVLAESSKTAEVEGNQYFPPEDVNKDYLEESDHRSTCPWKGEAHYFHVVVDGEKNENAAWSYPQPKEKAVHITGHFAFWKGVTVEE